MFIWRILSLLLILSAIAATALRAQETCAPWRRSSFEDVLGTSFVFASRDASPEEHAAAAKAALEEIARLEKILSSYREGSEWSRLVAGGRMRPISDELQAVLTACDQWYAKSRGAFDPMAAKGKGRPPFPRPWAAKPWTFDAEDQKAQVRAGFRPRLDGLAKGYVIDLAFRCGLDSLPRGASCLVDIGGDLRLQSAEVHEVDIANPKSPEDNAAPLRRLRLREGAIATSGGYARPDASGASHIIDPQTGKSAGALLSATAIGSACVDVDAIATALNVMTPSAGLSWVAELEGVECLLVDAKGRVHASAGIGRYLVKPTVATEGSASIVASGMELVLEFELARPKKTKRAYRRPYLAAWVEDLRAEKPVRALGLWYDRPRWLRDLKVWHRHYGKKKALIRTLSRATRRPGRYALRWDGRDDAGNKLPAGVYVIHLEVAREHGTHQHMRAEVTIEGEATKVKLAGVPNPEVKAAVVHLRPRAARKS